MSYLMVGGGLLRTFRNSTRTDTTKGSCRLASDDDAPCQWQGGRCVSPVATNLNKQQPSPRPDGRSRGGAGGVTEPSFPSWRPGLCQAASTRDWDECLGRSVYQRSDDCCARERRGFALALVHRTDRTDRAARPSFWPLVIPSCCKSGTLHGGCGKPRGFVASPPRAGRQRSSASHKCGSDANVGWTESEDACICLDEV
ncbi:hypothetical protein BGZ61DRAFT_568871 [Ilyonectria robusta]|uniref:uncharacterized protein n=1 Tax=Ilyonectria robusta TaxID=1079257 RepID=UPI001E8CCDF4|nr:uncharacterized protein BGZ61DRAFT_568871 [Ilyonectria robusta]KAH8729226.1 hypothetical protein BGZ61DRAFT_568871 [Ilyonectria robusta]